MIEEIPDKDIFMMCDSLNHEALSELPKGYSVRSCRENELDIWKAFPFDNPKDREEYGAYMTDFFNRVYKDKKEVFFSDTLFVCDKNDKPIATCLLWKAYGEFNTIHWLKVLKEYEGLGIGRALMSLIMRNLPRNEYPVYLHTQPGSYRAIKLYSDFGFKLLMDEQIGQRKNEIEECLPILEKYMPANDFQKLEKANAPSYFLNKLNEFKTNEF